MKKVAILIVLIALIAVSCEKSDYISQDSLIKKGWLHSQEEEAEDGYLIYRPSDFKEFPPSRFRQYFEFKDNNVCSYLVLAPNDAHFIQEGVWEYDVSTNIIRIINETDVIFEFQILELKKNILKVRML